MAKLGLKGLAMGVDKGWDLIPVSQVIDLDITETITH